MCSDLSPIAASNHLSERAFWAGRLPEEVDGRVLGLVDGRLLLCGFLDLAPDLRNPAHGCRLFPMPKRERFLSPEERRLLHAIIQAGLKIPAGQRGHLKLQSVWALDLLALTGRRRAEI